jgi:GrpE protein
VDLFGVLRVTRMPRARLGEPRVATPELPAGEQTIAQPPSGVPLEPSAAVPPPDVVGGLIGLADILLDLTEHPSGPESSVRTLHLVQRRVDRLLTDCGVYIVRDEGPVVPSRHEVVRTQPADENGTEGWIAATVRRGYLHGDRLIRPQQVVVYTVGQPPGTDERNNNGEE